MRCGVEPFVGDAYQGVLLGLSQRAQRRVSGQRAHRRCHQFMSPVEYAVPFGVEVRLHPVTPAALMVVFGGNDLIDRGPKCCPLVSVERCKQLVHCWPARSRSWNLRTLPLALRGSASTYSTWRGTL